MNEQQYLEFVNRAMTFEKKLYMGYPLRTLRNVADAEDVLSEAILSAWKCRSKYDPTKATLKNWFMTIVHNRTMDFLRRKNARQSIRACSLTDIPDDFVAGSIPDLKEELCLREERERQVTQARHSLNALSERDRNLYTMVYGYGVKFVTAAEHFSMPLGTVKSLINRTTTKLNRNQTRLAVQEVA